jgi:hypothetical protein
MNRNQYVHVCIGLVEVMRADTSCLLFFSLFINLLYEWSDVNFMGDIRGVVTTNIEDRFRKLAMKKFGYRKGSLSQALEEAICHWIELNKTKAEIEVKVKNPE